MKGTLTDRDLHAAEVEFPGITLFYLCSPARPRTFLELVFRYLNGRV